MALCTFELYSRPNNRGGSINEEGRLVNNGVIYFDRCMDSIISALQLRTESVCRTAEISRRGILTAKIATIWVAKKITIFNCIVVIRREVCFIDVGFSPHL